MHTAILAEDSVAIIAVGGGMSIAIIGIIFGSIKQMVRHRAREQSRREIAAYVAEGSMTAEEGERLMKAGERPKECRD